MNLLINANSEHIPLADRSVQMIATSPAYFGLRDYKVLGQIGMEQTPAEYVARLVAVFAECWRVLRDDGTLWLNLGDSYCSNGKGGRDEKLNSRGKNLPRGSGRWGGGNNQVDGLKPKDMIGIPWKVAFAVQAAGWYLRSDTVWYKPNQMPDGSFDRPTKSHEHVFLFSKSERYFFDKLSLPNSGRDVWEIPTVRYDGDHPAAFPPALAKTMILAGSRPGDTVLDPTCGVATSLVAGIVTRRAVTGCEIDPVTYELAARRLESWGAL